MTMAEQFVRLRRDRGWYTGEGICAGSLCCTNREGWVDRVIDGGMIFSHRDNPYTRATFTEGLHADEYYELLIYLRGEVEYVKENSLVKPAPWSVIGFAPGQVHTARLIEPSRYERVVLYFTDEFFRHRDDVVPMTDFMDKARRSAFALDESAAAEVAALIEKIDAVAKAGQPFGGLLIKAYLIELFGIFNRADIDLSEGKRLSDDMTEIKRYVDASYATIGSIGEMAERFHYSREHLSRKFKSRFNIAISDYLAKRRVLESLPLIGTMSGPAVAEAVGFPSQAAFIAAFKHHMGYLPSAYKRNRGEGTLYNGTQAN